MHLRIIQTAWNKKNFCNGILRQRTLFEQVYKIFGPYQYHKNQTLIMPYLLGKSRFGINFFTKRNTILLWYLYQVFIFLQDHLHFFLHFFSTFVENLFKKYPIFVQFIIYLIIHFIIYSFILFIYFIYLIFNISLYQRPPHLSITYPALHLQLFDPIILQD